MNLNHLETDMVETKAGDFTENLLNYMNIDKLDSYDIFICFSGDGSIH